MLIDPRTGQTLYQVKNDCEFIQVDSSLGQIWLPLTLYHVIVLTPAVDPSTIWPRVNLTRMFKFHSNSHFGHVAEFPVRFSPISVLDLV